MITKYKDSGGVDCVMVTNEDGSVWSGLKSAYDAMQAEQSTPMVTNEATTL
jgi:hypothetical protein